MSTRPLEGSKLPPEVEAFLFPKHADAISQHFTPKWQQELNNLPSTALMGLAAGIPKADADQILALLKSPFEKLLDLPAAQIGKPDPTPKIRSRGPKPEKSEAIKARLRDAVRAGKDIASVKQEALASEYGADRTVVIPARDAVLREFGLPIPRKRRRNSRAI